MVVREEREGKEEAMESKSLKFGMDRILSRTEKPHGGGEAEGREWRRKWEDASGAPGAPCAGCISSLFRCCTSPGLPHPRVHAPQPLRPYSNGEAEVRRSETVQVPTTTSAGARKKRSWSRAVFSNLQRKGLEKRFQLQKYITKPDRRQLAATLGLTDAQVKVWFQNRRMKWRHTKESSRQIQTTSDAEENILVSADSTQNQNTDSECESDIDVQTVDG